MDIERAIKEIKKELESSKKHLEGMRKQWEKPSTYNYGEMNGRIAGLKKSLDIIENIKSWANYSI